MPKFLFAVVLLAGLPLQSEAWARGVQPQPAAETEQPGAPSMASLIQMGKAATLSPEAKEIVRKIQEGQELLSQMSEEERKQAQEKAANIASRLSAEQQSKVNDLSEMMDMSKKLKDQGQTPTANFLAEEVAAQAEVLQPMLEGAMSKTTTPSSMSEVLVQNSKPSYQKVWVICALAKCCSLFCGNDNLCTCR
jgi:hypothetical protein